MKLILFSILLAVVYSWDDILAYLVYWIQKFRKKKHVPDLRNSDSIIADAVLLFMIPFSLIYFLESSGPIEKKLLLSALQLIAVVLLTNVSRTFYRRIKSGSEYHGWERVGLIGMEAISLVSPAIKLFYRSTATGSEILSKFAYYLSLPMLAGWILAKISPREALSGDVLPNINVLIVVMVGGLFISIFISFMERHFRMNNFKLMDYFRVLLGILVVVLIANGA